MISVHVGEHKEWQIDKLLVASAHEQCLQDGTSFCILACSLVTQGSGFGTLRSCWKRSRTLASHLRSVFPGTQATISSFTCPVRYGGLSGKRRQPVALSLNERLGVGRRLTTVVDCLAATREPAWVTKAANRTGNQPSPNRPPYAESAATQEPESCRVLTNGRWHTRASRFQLVVVCAPMAMTLPKHWRRHRLANCRLAPATDPADQIRSKLGSKGVSSRLTHTFGEPARHKTLWPVFAILSN